MRADRVYGTEGQRGAAGEGGGMKGEGGEEGLGARRGVAKAHCRCSKARG